MFPKYNQLLTEVCNALLARCYLRLSVLYKDIPSDVYLRVIFVLAFVYRHSYTPLKWKPQTSTERGKP